MTAEQNSTPDWGDFHARLHQLLKTPRPSVCSSSQRGADLNYLLPPRQSILIAVSGGQDSVALAGLLSGLQAKWDWRLAIAHCNHRWATREDEAAFQVERLAKLLNLPFFLRTADVPPRGEAGARQWRYAQLQAIAQQADFATVVTGHTASDRAETLLHNLARGSGLDGLAALSWQRPFEFGSQSNPGAATSPSPTSTSHFAQRNRVTALQLVRPLLGFSRSETAEICTCLGLEIWQDPINQDMSYARNRIRHRVLPELVKQTNARAVEHLAQTAELLEADVKYLELQAQALRQQAENGDRLNRQVLAAAPLALQRRVARQFLQNRLPQQPTARHVEKLVGLIQAPQGSQTDPFPGGRMAKVDDAWISLMEQAESASN